jgi:Protein of unknown function (DUF952)
VPAADWRQCKEKSEPYYPPTYQQDGFIHLTKEAAVLLPVANHFYRDVNGVLLSWGCRQPLTCGWGCTLPLLCAHAPKVRRHGANGNAISPSTLQL